MAESSTTTQVVKINKIKPITKKIGDVLNQAKNLKQKIPSLVPQPSRNIPYYMEARGCALKRPCLRKPSELTNNLVSEIFMSFFLPNGEVNIDLIERNVSLCPRKEDLLLIEDEDHHNLFQKAVILGDLGVVEILINHGCDVNGIKSKEVCGRGVTACPHDHLGALHLACFLGHLHVVQYLLEKGADPSLQMKVHPSATLNYASQQVSLNGVDPSRVSYILSQCGRRDPAFFAVLKNDVAVLKVLLQRLKTGEGPPAITRYLLHFACRVGVYESFEYLLGEYPKDINTRDPDGYPLLLMALNHNTKFVRLLLEQGCDLHELDEFLGSERNILNFLFHGETTKNLRTQEGLSDIVKMCLTMGVDVNSQSRPSKSTPLHGLLENLNPVMKVEKVSDSDSLGHHLRNLDKERMDCFILLVNHGADLQIKDRYNRIPLQILLSNTNHILRYNMSKNNSISASLAESFESESYGLVNTLEVIKILVPWYYFRVSGSSKSPQDDFVLKDKNLHLPIIKGFVDLLCLRFHWPASGLVHPFQILKENSIFEKYKEILEIILHAGANPNIASLTNQTPPLFGLLSPIAKLPYNPGYLIDFEMAKRVASFVSILASHGALTEVQIEILGVGPRVIGCFDMVIPALASLEDNPHPCKDPRVIHVLALALIQNGAKAIVFHNLLYHTPDTGEFRARDYLLHPKHIFLFQVLMFGLSNLSWVNVGPWYNQLFNLLYSQIDHQSLYYVLGLVMREFSTDHPGHCECGRCGQFRVLLDSVFDKPRTLKKLARLVIYNSLQGRLQTKLPEVPLPSAIKQYCMTLED